ncbi:MAG: DEAD/DEAH box helicase [Burkholderia sp.]|nr:DEAD/DEAH box helicase [Burkholderia sp.]
MSDSMAMPVDNITFDQFGFSTAILNGIKDQGYTIPTPIQAKAIPVVLSGFDVIGSAQTGTGKTASFSLPILQRLLPHANKSASPARHPIRALILTPTRELADQVAENIRLYSKYTLLKSTVVFGGVDMNFQIAELCRGVEILTATPGRLLDHIQKKIINLGQVQILVLDEADRMLDMGFLPDLHRIINLLPKERQTLLFSATFSEEIKKLAYTYLHNIKMIEVEQRNSTNTNVTQIVYNIAESDKHEAVIQLIRDHSIKKAIVFCNSKISVNRLSRKLEHDGIVSSAIHGNKSQIERSRILNAFKRGEIEVLVATDVAARGLDIVQLPVVINFDLPLSADDYVHRIGRTGRAGGAGMALSLCSPKERKQLVDIEKLIKHTLDIQTIALNKYTYHRRSKNYDPASSHTQSNSNYLHNHEKPIDPFFLKPYEPSTLVNTDEKTEKSLQPQQDKRIKQRTAILLSRFIHYEKSDK